MAQGSVTNQPGRTALLARHMLIGASIAFVLIAVFLWGVDGRPEWGQYWKIRPHLVVTFAGAIGGLCWHLLDFIRQRGFGYQVLAGVLGIFIYIFGLWMGSVLGLNGTLWN
jgi:hypothetical protein